MNNLERMRELVTAHYGDKFVEPKTFPHLFSWNFGGWHFNCPMHGRIWGGGGERGGSVGCRPPPPPPPQNGLRHSVKYSTTDMHT